MPHGMFDPRGSQGGDVSPLFQALMSRSMAPQNRQPMPNTMGPGDMLAGMAGLPGMGRGMAPPMMGAPMPMAAPAPPAPVSAAGPMPPAAPPAMGAPPNMSAGPVPPGFAPKPPMAPPAPMANRGQMAIRSGGSGGAMRPAGY